MLIIIGTGLAGYNLAKEWRKHDALTPLMLITQDNGDFYSKPMLSTALAQGKKADDIVIHTVEEMEKQLQAVIKTYSVVEELQPKNKTLLVREPGKTALCSYSYTYCVLATGATPLQPSWTKDLASEHIHRINRLEDYRRFREKLETQPSSSIAIIGSGLVGCEFANDLITSKYTVTVLSCDTHPLAQLLPDFAGNNIATGLSQHGVSWNFNDPVCSLSKEDGSEQFRILCRSGTSFSADHIISACGLTPQTELAQKASLTIDPLNKAIACDRFLQSSDPFIYALGDCLSLEGLNTFYIAPLMQGARALAKTLSGTKTAVSYPAMPISIKTRLCPILVYPSKTSNNWQIIDNSPPHLKAITQTEAGLPTGFILMGDYLKERHSWTEKMPPLIAD
jgi:rubredoxin---NAD+ reductase